MFTIIPSNLVSSGLSANDLISLSSLIWEDGGFAKGLPDYITGNQKASGSCWLLVPFPAIEHLAFSLREILASQV